MFKRERENRKPLKLLQRSELERMKRSTLLENKKVKWCVQIILDL